LQLEEIKTVLLLTNENGEKVIQCDLFADAAALTPNHLVTIFDEDGGVKWYVLGGAIQAENGWIVPIQVVDEEHEAEARRTGTIRDFVAGPNGGLA